MTELYVVTAQIQFKVQSGDMGEAVAETQRALSLVRDALPCVMIDVHIRKEDDDD